MTPDSPHERFRLVLLAVVSPAYHAAGYELDHRPAHWSGGLFRFVKPFEDGEYAGMQGVIEYQHQTDPEADYVGTFRISLARTGQPGRTPGVNHKPVRRSLSALVVEDFRVRILPIEEYWWEYHTVTELGDTLAESGHLTVGYGMPWLSGDLIPS